jgi:hypothetical protein
VALEDPCGHRLDRSAICHVADLDLAADVLGKRTQAIFTARDEDTVPPLLGEQARRRFPDAGGRSRYDGDALNTFTVPRLISTVSRMSSA